MIPYGRSYVHPSRPDSAVAVITGGAQGIGRAIAETLHADGWYVATVDLRPHEGAADRWLTVEADVAERDSLRAAVDKVRSAAGPPLAVIANAGTWRDATIGRMSDDDWHTVVQVDLTAAFLLVREVWQDMRDAGFGRFVAISSISKNGNYGQANYAAAKQGLLGLASTVAVEGAAHGITGNVVCPGVIETPAQAAFRDRAPEAYAAFLAGVPGSRTGWPDDIASAVRYFASDAAGYVNGQVLYVDGGMNRAAG
jgi:3-oxoacyl-[acyl-carrier protein] reductase